MAKVKQPKNDMGKGDKSSKGMGDAAKVSSKGKEDMKLVPGGSESKPGYDTDNEIWPEDDGKKKNPNLDMGMFSKDKLSSSMPTDGSYAAKAKRNYYDESTFKYKKDIEIWPSSGFGVGAPVN